MIHILYKIKLCKYMFSFQNSEARTDGDIGLLHVITYKKSEIAEYFVRISTFTYFCALKYIIHD